MAKSPVFLFAIIVTVAVCFVMVAAQMQSKTPTGGIYSNTSAPENATANLIGNTMNIAPNWVLPAIFLGAALVIISVVFLFKRH